MNKDVAELTESQEFSAGDDTSSAADVMLAMVRAAKGLKIYLPNNPVLIKFLEELSAKTTAHIAQYGDLVLDVEPFTLRYKGHEVYQNPDPKESLAFRIHSDGIRALLFMKGIERRELSVFLGIVAFDQSTPQDDDVVTQLWATDLPHMHYVLEEDFAETDLEEETGVVSQQDALARIHHAVTRELPPAPRAIPKHLLTLTQEEAAWLRHEKQAEVHRNSVEDVIDILAAIIAGTDKPDIFKEFVEITARLTANLLYGGEFSHALRLVRFLDRSLKKGGVSAGQQAVLRQAITGLLNDGTVQVLQETIDSSDAVGHDELRELLQILGLQCLPAICELLGRVEKLKMRKVIVEVLVELGRDKPEVFAPFLSDPRWYLVRNLVLVLSLLGTPVALEMIVGLISHKEQRIRKEVLGFLERSTDPKAKTYILKYLRDDSSALRIRALQILSRERPPFALKPALALTTADDFKTKNLAEKKAVYEAIGEIGAGRMIPLFREMLLKKRWFMRGVEKESAVCAVAGLLRIRNAAALKVLEEARAQRNAEVRAVIEEAIASLNKGQPSGDSSSVEV